MIICGKCGHEMNCLKNNVGVEWSRGHVRLGDAFICNPCEHVVIVANNRSIFDPEHKAADVYYGMASSDALDAA